jgi:glucokinase
MVGAVDIGGTKIAVGIVDSSGKVLATRDMPSGIQCSYSDGVTRIIEILRALAIDTGVEIRGIGIGSTGPVNPLTGTFGEIDLLPSWRQTNPAEELARAFGVGVAVENDADAGALGEAVWGSGKGKKRLIYVTIGTGIGAGIILDGQLYRGVDGAHPEIGHHVIEASGPSCTCGLQGCWEALATGPAMAEWFHQENLTNENSEYAGWTAREICEGARRGNELARRAVRREALYLGLGMANLINLFTPDAIVLGGSMMKSADVFLADARAIVQKGCRFVPADKCEIVLASLGENANLIGAAQVWYHRFTKQGESQRGQSASQVP